MTRLLLQRGANPNDNESLYHSLSPGSLDCTRLLLKAGAKVAESNAMLRVLDFDNLPALELLLRYGGDPNECGSLRWAIRRRRSPAHVAALLHAGANADGMHLLALRYGLPEVARLLPAPLEIRVEDQFVAACAVADAARAQAILDAHPGLMERLTEEQLRSLPELAFAGCDDAVRCMVTLGWPIAVRGGDWQASALNAAVFRGDAELTAFLLERGASWQESHGYGDNVGGTLQFASRNRPVDDGDWEACAEILYSAGMPVR